MKTLRLPWRLFAMVLAYSFAAAAPAFSADEAAALLAKHKAFVGWEVGDGSIKSLVLDGTIASRAKDGSRSNEYTTHQVEVGIIYRMTEISVKRGDGTVSGFTGSKFWSASPSGFTVPNLSEERGAILAQRVVFAEATGKLPVTLVKHQTLNGSDVAVLRETPPGGKPIDLYVDPASGAYKRFVYDSGGASETSVDIDDYADALPGKKVVSRWHYTGSPRTRYIDKIAANTPISNAELEPPPGRAKWKFGNGSAIVIKSGGERTIIPATVNGVAGRFILDTGADGIVFTDTFADKAHIHRGATVQFEGIGGHRAGSAATADAIAFSDGSVLQGASVLTGMTTFTDPDGPLDGLLGFDFLAGAIVDVDFDNNKLTLYDPATTAPSESQGVVVVADLQTGQPVIPVRLDGKVDSHALLDSGMPGPNLFLSHDLEGKVTMLESQDPNSVANELRIFGVSGAYEIAHCGTIGKLEIGPINYSGTGACFTGSITPGTVMIGYRFLQNFNLTFDYPDAKIVMQPRKGR